jgi:hypothetical protein
MLGQAHIGVDAASGLVHTVIGMAGNVSDIMQAHALPNYLSKDLGKVKPVLPLSLVRFSVLSHT